MQSSWSAGSRYFDRSRFLILRSEDFFTDPAATIASIEEFLEIRHWQPNGVPQSQLRRASRPAVDDS